MSLMLRIQCCLEVHNVEPLNDIDELSTNGEFKISSIIVWVLTILQHIIVTPMFISNHRKRVQMCEQSWNSAMKVDEKVGSYEALLM